MKKIFFYAATCLVIGFAVLSCNKEEIANDTENEISTEDIIEVSDNSINAKIESAGEKHNRLLDVYYNELEEFVNLNGINAVTPGVVKNLFSDEIVDVHFSNEGQHVIDYAETTFSNGINGTEADYLQELEDSQDFSLEFKETMNDFLLELYDVNVQPTTTGEKDIFCQDWITEVKSSISDLDERSIALDMIDILDHSFDYWELNKIKWRNLIDPNGTSPIPSSINIAGADVAGGIGGAVSGAVGLLPGAIGGAVVGSVGASVCAAVIEFWDWMGW